MFINEFGKLVQENQNFGLFLFCGRILRAARTPSPALKNCAVHNPLRGDMARFSPPRKCNVRASPWTTGLNDHR
uniref:Uncharacterized protein n=1 Tax=Globodera rostochiensis TaxID=31243 RepID=A0A914H7I1_GLORO